MIILLNVFFLLASTLAYSQTDSDLLNKDRRVPFARFDKRLYMAEESVNVASPYLDKKGVKILPLSLKTERNENYPALKIEIFGNSSLNKEASRVAKLMGGMPLIFSPFDLSFGSKGYLLPDGSHLGVSYRFLVDGLNDSTYQHELLHATNLNDIVDGKTPLWAGEMKVLEYGTYVSTKNTEGYSGFAALDEILTSALSVKLDAEKLAKLRASVSDREFNDRWGRGHELISDLRFTALNGQRLSSQLTELCEKSLSNLNSVKIESAPMKIGSKIRSRFHAVFVLDAYKGYGRSQSSIKNGTRFTLYYGSRPTVALIKNRLERILKLSREAAPRFEAVVKSVHMGLEIPDVSKSDVPSLVKSAPGAFEVLSK